MHYGGFWKRFGAWVLDLAITGFLSGLLGMAVLSLIALSLSLDGILFDLITRFLLWITLGTLVVLDFLYYGFFWSQHGNSLGMKAFEIKVERTTPGANISFFRAGLRGTLGYFLSAILFGLGYLWALIDRRKQAWHDKLFDTIVVPEFPADAPHPNAG